MQSKVNSSYEVFFIEGAPGPGDVGVKTGVIGVSDKCFTGNQPINHPQRQNSKHSLDITKTNSSTFAINGEMVCHKHIITCLWRGN